MPQQQPGDVNVNNSNSGGGWVPAAATILVIGIGFGAWWLVDNHQRQIDGMVLDNRFGAVGRSLERLGSEDTNLHGQIDALGNRVAETEKLARSYEPRMNSFQRDLDQVRGTVTELDKTVAVIDGHVTKLDKDIAAVQGTVNTEVADRKASESKARREYRAGFAEFSRRFGDGGTAAMPTTTHQQVHVVYPGADEAVVIDFDAIKGSTVNATARPVEYR